MDTIFEHVYDTVKTETGGGMSAERDRGWAGDSHVVGPGDNGHREGLGDLDDMLRDDLGVDDPVRLQRMFDRDQSEYEAMTAGIESIGADFPPPTTPAEFADELIDSGPDAAAAILDAMEPGPETAAMLAMLRPAVLTPAAMVSVVSATEKLLSWAQARQHKWIAAFACPDVVASRQALKQYASQPGQPLHQTGTAGPTNRDEHASGAVENGDADGATSSAVHGDSTTDAVLTEVALNVAAAEIGAALHFTPMTSKRRVCQAVDYAIDLPATLRAMEAGKIDRGRAGVIAERTQNLPSELRRRVECSVLPKAEARTTGQVRGIVDRAVISVDPQAAKKRLQRAIAKRNVTYRAAEDGIGVFRAELGADRAQVAHSIIDQLAAQLNRAPSETGEIDDRGIGALRADVFSDLFDQLACTGTITLHSTLMRRAAADSTQGSIPKSRPADRRAEHDKPSGAEPHSPSAADSKSPSGARAGSASNANANARSTAESNGMSGRAHSDHGQPADRDPAEFSETSSHPSKGEESIHLDEDALDDAAELDNRLGETGANSDSDMESVAEGDRQSMAESSGDAHGSSYQSASAEAAEIVGAAAEAERRLAAAVEAGDLVVAGAEAAGRLAASSEAGDLFGAAAEARDLLTAGAHAEDGCAAAAKTEDHRQLGTHHGRHTHLNVTIAESTLAGLDDRPGELEGHGPIPADLARAIAISAETISAIAIRPGCGSALDIGRTSYRPRLAQRDYVTTRDQTCRFPGCRRAAKRCQIDHSDEYCPGKKDGGVTCPCNLCCLCAFHHGLKTGGLWDSVQHPDATITWTSPTGREYTTYPRHWPTERDDEPILDIELGQSAVSNPNPAPPPSTASTSNLTASNDSKEFTLASGDAGRADCEPNEVDDEPPF